MDYTALEKLLEQENLEPKKIWKFFGTETQKAMEDLIIENINSIKMDIDDGVVYLAPAMIYEIGLENSDNIFYEKLMQISFFLKGFAKYEDVIIEAFSKAIGVINFVFIAEKNLADNQFYQFFKESYNDFKQAKYFKEQTDRMLSIFDEIASQVENLDLEETKKILQEFKDFNDK
jgi:hypothetical protein